MSLEKVPGERGDVSECHQLTLFDLRTVRLAVTKGANATESKPGARGSVFGVALRDYCGMLLRGQVLSAADRPGSAAAPVPSSSAIRAGGRRCGSGLRRAAMEAPRKPPPSQKHPLP